MNRDKNAKFVDAHQKMDAEEKKNSEKLGPKQCVSNYILYHL